MRLSDLTNEQKENLYHCFDEVYGIDDNTDEDLEQILKQLKNEDEYNTFIFNGLCYYYGDPKTGDNLGRKNENSKIIIYFHVLDTKNDYYTDISLRQLRADKNNRYLIWDFWC